METSKIILCHNNYIKVKYIWKHICDIKKGDIVTLQHNLEAEVKSIKEIKYSTVERSILLSNEEKITCFNDSFIYHFHNYVNIGRLKKNTKISYRIYFPLEQIDKYKNLNKLWYLPTTKETSYLLREYYAFLFDKQCAIKQINEQHYLIPINKKTYKKDVKTLKYYNKNSKPLMNRVIDIKKRKINKVFILELDKKYKEGVAVNGCCYIK